MCSSVDLCLCLCLLCCVVLVVAQLRGASNVSSFESRRVEWMTHLRAAADIILSNDPEKAQEWKKPREESCG